MSKKKRRRVAGESGIVIESKGNVTVSMDEVGRDKIVGKDEGKEEKEEREATPPMKLSINPSVIVSVAGWVQRVWEGVRVWMGW